MNIFFLRTSMLSLLMWSGLLYAEKVFVQKPDSSHDSEFSGAMYELITQAVEGFEDQEIVNTEAEATLILVPKVITLGDAAIVTLSSHDKKKGETASQKLKIRSIDELDIAAERLVDALFDDKKVDDTSEVGQITREEQIKLSKRKKSMGRWFLGFGPAMAQGLGSDEASMIHLIGGYAWELDTALLKLELESISGMNGSDAYLGGMGLGYTHLFSLASHSPILSADLIWGSATTDKKESTDIYGKINDESDHKNGFILGLGVGYLFYRTSDVNLETSLVYSHFLGSVDGTSPGSLATRISLYF